MASINGVAVKSVKTFTGHDGPGYLECNVYLDSRKLGHWAQDAWCGPDIFDFDASHLSNICTAYAEGFEDAYPGKQFFTDIHGIESAAGMLISDLITLTDIEREYKRLAKQGYTEVIYLTDGWCGLFTGRKPDADRGVLLPEQVLKEQQGTIDKLMDEHASDFDGRPVWVCAFTSLADFNLIVDKPHSVPPYLYSAGLGYEPSGAWKAA